MPQMIGGTKYSVVDGSGGGAPMGGTSYSMTGDREFTKMSSCCSY